LEDEGVEFEDDKIKDRFFVEADSLAISKVDRKFWRKRGRSPSCGAKSGNGNKRAKLAEAEVSQQVLQKEILDILNRRGEGKSC